MTEKKQSTVFAFIIITVLFFLWGGITSINDVLIDNYKKNKKLAIDFTREFLKDTSDWLEYFENYKNKKDDLADAYLMIRYRLKTI